MLRVTGMYVVIVCPKTIQRPLLVASMWTNKLYQQRLCWVAGKRSSEQSSLVLQSMGGVGSNDGWCMSRTWWQGSAMQLVVCVSVEASRHSCGRARVTCKTDVPKCVQAIHFVGSCSGQCMLVHCLSAVSLAVR